MQSKTGLGLMLLMAALVLFAGISCAGEHQVKETEVLLKGSLNQSNQFVAEDGQIYDLAINEKTAELLDMPRQMIEIKGTLMEQGSQTTLIITDISSATP